MNDKKNDDMAGIVSERGGVPDVKPVKSLWPRPHENVRVEPILDPPRAETAPRVSVPTGDFETVPTEGYQEPVVPQPEPGVELEAGELEAGLPEASEPEAEAPAREEPPVEAISEEIREEPVLAIVPDPDPVAEDQPSISVESEPDPLRVHADDRTAAVLDAADEQEPALEDPAGSRAGQFIAMAAGVVVALALGAAAFMYGASGLGIDFGGGDPKTTAGSAPPPATTPVAIVNPDDLKAAKQQIEELQARLDRLEAEKTAAAAAAAKSAAAPTPAPTPAPRPDTVAAVPAPTPTPPPPQASAPAPASPATPAATAGNTAPSTPARSEPTPAAPKPRPAETARAEPAPQVLAPPPAPLAPPPSYQTQPSYEEPRAAAASPEMPVLQDWAVRDVYNGIAVVQSGRGAPMEVSPGDQLPGGNRVLAIRRLGGDWAVITERGIIAGR